VEGLMEGSETDVYTDRYVKRYIDKKTNKLKLNDRKQ
jgi:hypothetical protein